MKRVLQALVAVFALFVVLPAFAAEPDKPKWDVNAPPGPHHDARIDTTTGTWMSVDVSPDGKEIVFDLLGDIYTMPITGGEAHALTSGVAWDMQPRYSPNGKWIAFTSDRGGGDNIWVMNRDGSNAHAVTKESFRLLNSPNWSPDSDYIVARKHFTASRSLGAGEMWMYHRSGTGDGLQLTTKRTDQKDSGEPAFSPDGRYLYFSDDSTPGRNFEYSKDVNGQIYVIQRLDRKTGEVEPYVTGPGGSIRPTPSPDGKTLAFVRRVRYKSVLYLLDIATGRETPVYDGLDRDMQETWAIHGVYPAMAWTPDHQSIVLWAGGHIRRIDVSTAEVTGLKSPVSEIPFHVTGTRQVTEAVRFAQEVAPDQFKVKMLRWAQVSPQGDRVVYQALGHLWIKDLKAGTPAHRLTAQTKQFEFYPAWSRDGKKIVYVSWDDKHAGAVRVVASTGGEGTILTDAGHYVEPAFSPDGTKIVYRATSDGFLTTGEYAQEQGLFVVSADGKGKPFKVSSKGSLPQFGASNDRVFFLTNEDEDKRALRSINLNGSEERTHFMSAYASQFAVSPDEKWLAWTERYNAYITPFVSTGKAVTLSPDSKAIPVAKATKDSGEYLHWSGDSKRLWWTLGPELYSRDLKDSFAFLDGAPEKLPPAAEHGADIGFMAPYAKPSGRIALTGARIVTMKGDEIIEDGTIVLNGNRIEAVGPRASVAIPAGAKVIDAAGKTITPGIVDVHWHGSMGSEQIQPQQSWVNYATLAFGVTTIHDPSNDSFEVFASSELDKAGITVGPRIYSTGTILYGAKTAFTAEINSLDDALGHLRRQQALGAFSVKSYNQPRREQRQQVIEAARELHMDVVPEGGSLFMHNMTMVVDGHTGVEHSIPVANAYDDVRQLWSQTQVGYTPTLIVGYGGMFGENYWYQHTDVWADPRLSTFVPRRILDARSRRRTMAPEEEYNHISNAKIVRALNDAGVSVQLGAHGQREGLGAHWEMWMMAQGGMPAHQVLKAATINGARYLGLDKDIGSLEPGKLADLVVFDRNPLANIRDTTSIKWVMVNGRMYDSMTMNEVAPTPTERAPFWFEGAAGQQAWGAGAAKAMAAAAEED